TPPRRGSFLGRLPRPLSVAMRDDTVEEGAQCGHAQRHGRGALNVAMRNDTVEGGAQRGHAQRHGRGALNVAMHNGTAEVRSTWPCATTRSRAALASESSAPTVTGD